MPPSTNSKGSRYTQLLTDDEAEEFRNIFKDLITSQKQIMSSLVLSRLKGNSILSHLSEKFTKQQLADKIRTERRIWARGAGKSKGKR